MKKTLIIIGGGASGLSSAIHAYDISNGKIDIIILEKLNRVGKKILATGNGRCNFTNKNVTYKNYYSKCNGENEDFTKYFLEEFGVNDTINFFYNLGVLHKELEYGKTYPYSEQASSIVDALRYKIEQYKIEIKTEFEVININKKGEKFKITSKDYESLYADNIIVATGGNSNKVLGSDGIGMKILEKMGHTKTKLTPALVQLKTDANKIKSLKGIKITGNLKIYTKVDNELKFLREHYGEILFTEYGISGPPVFSLSILFGLYKNLVAHIDIMPEFDYIEVLNMLKERKKILEHTTMENFFGGFLNKRIGNIIAKSCGIEKLSFKVINLDDNMLKTMTNIIKSYELDIIDTNGFNNSQVTIGGIVTDEFDRQTLQSKIVKGLYCTGEILDIAGDCGGYNLQWAWTSSYIASASCVKEMLKEKK